MKKAGRIALKTFLWIIGSVIGLFIVVVILIRIPAVQQFVVHEITGYLENKIKTPVRIAHVTIDFPKMLVLQGVYFEDQQKDTLLLGEQIKVNINMLKLLKSQVEISDIELKGITTHISRRLPDSAFNFDYIINAFVSGEKEPSKPDTAATPMSFALGNINLDSVRFSYNDDVVGIHVVGNLQHLDTYIDTFDLDKMRFGFPKININGFKGNVNQWAVAVAAKTATPDTSALPDIGLKDINLQHIDFGYVNESLALNTHFKVTKLVGEVNKFDLNGELVDIKSVELAGSDSRVAFGQIIKSDTSKSSGEPVNWKVKAGTIQVSGTDFVYEDANQPILKKGVDYFHMGINLKNARMESLYYSADSICGSLKNLSAKEKSGFVLNRLESDFIYTNHGAILNRLYAETPHTLIRNYMKVNYPSIDRIIEHPEDIVINATIKESKLGMQDVFMLVPSLDTMKVMQPLLTRTFAIDGIINGRVDDLDIPKLTVSTGVNTFLNARAHIKGLPDTNVNHLFMDLNLAEFRTGKRDIDSLVAKSLMPDSIEIPAQVALKGTFNGGINQFKTNMHLLSSMGAADVNATYAAGRDTTYDATVSIRNIDVGHFLKMDSTLGKFSFAGHVKGSSLDPAKAVAVAKAQLISGQLMGYTYSNVLVDVQASGGQITAKASSEDPNISFKLNAEANLAGTNPTLKLDLMADTIKLKELKLTPDDIRYHGQLVADFSSANPDHLNGMLRVLNSSIFYNNAHYALDTLRLTAEAKDSTQRLIFDSEFLRAQMIGKYQLTALPLAFQDVIKTYYSPDTTHTGPVLKYAPQQFEFSAELIRSKTIQRLLPGLSEMQKVTLDGNFESTEKSINAKLLAPKIVYGGTIINDVGFDINTADSVLYYSAVINKMAISNLELNNTLLSGTAHDNLVDIGLWIKDKQDKEQYHLGSTLQFFPTYFKFGLRPDGLILNYDQWEVNKGNAIGYGKKGILTHAFYLKHDNQELSITSQDSVFNAPIKLTFKDFRIETFTKIIESDNLKIGGGINGDAIVSRLDTAPVFTSDINIHNFYFGTDTIGDIGLKVDDARENTYAADVSITGKGNNARLTGDYYSPPGSKATFNFDFDVKNLNMSTVEAFSLGYLRRSSGGIHGLLKLTGDVDAPRINGDLNFDKVNMNVAMLNATMRIDQQKITFDDTGLNFNRFTLTDSVGSRALLNGSIATTTYTDFDFDLTLRANNFQVVNSTKKDNNLFYGKLFLNSNLRVKGDMHHPVVDGSLKVNDKTDFAFIIPDDNPGMVEREGIVRFVDRSDTSHYDAYAKLDSLKQTEIIGLDLSVNLEIDKNAAFTIVVDQGTGDALYVKGSAQLTAGMDPSGAITMSGVYEVEQGNYNFSFNLIKKKFNFKKGSTITWAGDPFSAQLDITALYNIQTTPIDLVQNQVGNNSSVFKQRIPFVVDLNIRGEMMKPELSFDIELNSDNASVSQDVSSTVDTKLTQLRQDPSEMNKQVFALIVLGRFIAENPFASSAGGGGAESMARGQLSQFLSDQLNRLAADLIAGVQLNFDLQSTDDYTTGSQQNRTDLNVGVSKTLLDDRLKVTVGSNFELEGPTRPGAQTTNIAGDISVEYQLSRDGRYVMRAYRKNQYQVTLQGQFVETGIGFIINMDYDVFKELFMNASKRQERDRQRQLDRERLRDSIRTDSAKGGMIK
ncbi:Family of unknown function [bacterium A37T11]|nr:Family of unknown function [bacterium A37T11]